MVICNAEVGSKGGIGPETGRGFLYKMHGISTAME
jgi:hypothetical protein